MKIPCSVPILTLNCLPVLQRMLPLLVETFADVFIVDGNSTDGTQEFAQSLGVRVEKQFATDEPNQRITDFRTTRMFSWTLCKYDWLFVLDSDEVPTPELISLIGEIVQRDDQQVVHCFKRYPQLANGRVIRNTPFYSAHYVRLFSLRVGVTLADRKVHERFMWPAGLRQVLHPEAIICPEPDPAVLAKRARHYVELETAANVPPTWHYLFRWIVWYNARSFVGQLVRVIVTQLQNLFSGQPSLPWAYNFCFLAYRWWSARALWQAWRRERQSGRVL